jgi:hypothetical protein
MFDYFDWNWPKEYTLQFGRNLPVQSVYSTRFSYTFIALSLWTFLSVFNDIGLLHYRTISLAEHLNDMFRPSLSRTISLAEHLNDKFRPSLNYLQVHFTLFSFRRLLQYLPLLYVFTWRGSRANSIQNIHKPGQHVDKHTLSFSPEKGVIITLRNVRIYPQVHTALQPRSVKSTCTNTKFHLHLLTSCDHIVSLYYLYCLHSYLPKLDRKMRACAVRRSLRN